GQAADRPRARSGEAVARSRRRVGGDGCAGGNGGVGAIRRPRDADVAGASVGNGPRLGGRAVARRRRVREHPGRRAADHTAPRRAPRRAVQGAPGRPGDDAQDPAPARRGGQPEREQGGLRRRRPGALLLEVPGPVRPRQTRRRSLQAHRPLRLPARRARGLPPPATLAARGRREARAVAIPRERDPDHGRRDRRAHDRSRHGSRPPRRRSSLRAPRLTGGPQRRALPRPSARSRRALGLSPATPRTARLAAPPSAPGTGSRSSTNDATSTLSVKSSDDSPNPGMRRTNGAGWARSPGISPAPFDASSTSARSTWSGSLL